MLNKVIVGAREGKAEMEQYMQVEEAYFSKTRKREELRTRLKVLRLQLAEQQRMEQEGTYRYGSLIFRSITVGAKGREGG